MESAYRPLVGNEVRFVRIQPGAWTDPIRCDLVCLPLPDAETDVVEAWFSGRPLPKLLHEELYDPRTSSTSSSLGDPSEAPTVQIPPFVALSYARGEPNCTQELFLDGQPVQKTINLIAALRQLRALLADPSRAPDIFRNSSTLFWIDALCINQSDNAEKSTQVPRMAAIYGAAEFVLAWLGENEDDDTAVQEFVNLVNTIDLQDKARTIASYTRIINALNSAELTHILDGYKSLGRRPWFKRTWVIQETVMSRYTIILAGSCWCDYEHLSSVCLAAAQSHFHDLVINESGMHRPINHSIFASTLRNTIQCIFEGRFATRSDPLSVASQNEVGDEDYDQCLSEFDTTDEGGLGHFSSIFEDWTNDAEDLWESPAVAQEFLSTKLLAFLLRAALSALIARFEATIPHDYLYGIISLGGIMVFPRNLVPDYTLPFEDVFHQYTELILRHTGDLTIIPRRRHGLKGVPSWVPDYGSSKVILKHLDKDRQLSVNPDVSVSDDGRVCSTRGAHLGNVTMVLDYSCSDRTEEERANTNNRLDQFFEYLCKQAQVDKHDVLEEIHRILNRTGYPGFQESSFQRAYNEYGSEFPSSDTQGQITTGDIWTKVTRTIRDNVCFLTSRGLILNLERDDEQPREGDVLVLLKGANHPWLLRPIVESNAKVYTFVGACPMLYRNSQSSGMEDWPSSRWADVPEEILGHFFESNDVREFRLV